VSVGEILKLTRSFNWGEPNIKKLEGLLRNLVRIEINRSEILEAYAEIAHFCENGGRTKPQNDYWIAATGKATNATLLTTDKHFDDLHGRFLERVFVDESSCMQ